MTLFRIAMIFVAPAYFNRRLAKLESDPAEGARVYDETDSEVRGEAPWPHDCYALQEGASVRCGEGLARHSVIDCGVLNMESGQLIACDPFSAMRGESQDEWIRVPKGSHPVKVTLADVSEQGDGSHIREAYASLLLSTAPEVERRNLYKSIDGTAPEPLESDEHWGFEVDAATACFVDRLAVDRDMPEPESWLTDLFEYDKDEPPSWFAQMDDPAHIRGGIDNIQLPESNDGSNIVIVHSGSGDGFYPVIGGFDVDGHLVAVHIDFMVVGGLVEEA